MSRNILITGASRGIGEAMARRFAQAGDNIVICCRSSGDALTQLAESIRQEYHVQVLTFVGDVADHDFIKTMIDASLKKMGHIDILVNNAGISYVGLFSDMTIDEWNKVVNTNLTSVFSTCKYVIPGMIANKAGKIINISSVWGNVGASCEVAYSATKGAVNSLTKALGKELAPSNIQVNAIACGCIDTQMNACFSQEDRDALAEEIPAGRFGKSEEVAHLAFQLAEGNSYLNGQVITLDGGWI